MAANICTPWVTQHKAKLYWLYPSIKKGKKDMNKPDKVKAVVMTSPGRVECQELPYPDHLEPGALIVKMELSGICGTDKHAFDGDVTLYGGTQSEQDIVFPCVHGHENS